MRTAIVAAAALLLAGSAQAQTPPAPAAPFIDWAKIEIKTTWKGLTIRARRGYVATPLPRPRPVNTGGQ